MNAQVTFGGCLLCLAFASAYAQTPGATHPGSAQGEAQACGSCHGGQGEGNAAKSVPRLAGQPAYYLQKQLADFAAGTRASPVMGPIAKALKADQQQALARHYAALSAPAPGAGGRAAGERGRQLAEVGDEQRGIQACVNCHGPEGTGEPPLTPYLAGQHPGYLAATLQAWKDRRRRNDSSGQMPEIARRLSAEEIAQVSAYFARKAPPGAR